MHKQSSFPARLLFLERVTEHRYTADAISAGDLPDLERDIGACCRFDGPPRYKVDGVERPDFDPTIPDDLYASGWHWHGGSLHRPSPGGSTGVVIGMPRESLQEVWDQARKVTAASEKIRAQIAADKAQKPIKKAKQKPATAPKPAPTVVAAQPTYAQIAMEL